MKNAWNPEINLKKKGKKDLPASKDKNLAKILKENDKKKNGWWSLEPTRRERKEKNYLKSKFEKVQICLLKNLIHEFRSVENQPRSVETDKDSLSQILKILKISIGRKTKWTDRIRQSLTIFFEEKHKFWKNKLI